MIICHACISYLNSWQSFKNRCDAAQRKQKIWLSSNDASKPNSIPLSNQQSLLKSQVNGHGNVLKPAIQNAQQKFQASQAEMQRKKLQQLVQRQQGIETGFIKSEPQSEEEVSWCITSFAAGMIHRACLLCLLGGGKRDGVGSNTISGSRGQRR